ncbi:sodium channel and clathrin linker 1 isoform X1 [Tachysurus vachellii]|uniref:sodium channel and clathrin linker 1 isoform X1 n=2 Tax=Tachysurus vachellii TaxID=175792 RepID=UPI00296B33C0|nr:sodium channel and clathrin linker 1 isoform X1 [Tachysurus vachellii]XP_060720715.1 sodium channel and clathrin linker 1 isoform X1 [Tachysurus vachellii]XP_060720717.1 sodium channel and clathrin linker 1 isoform X1 [Tachysurus vachellii]
MASELDFLRDQVNRLNLVLGRYQDAPSAFTQNEDEVCDSAALWSTDQGIMAPLIVEYDRHIQQMEKQLKLYQRQMVDVRASLEQVVCENERLYAEQRLSVEKQLQTLSVDEDAADTVTVTNLEEQVKCAVEEKERAVQMWQVAAQELDRLQKLYQTTMRDEHIHSAQHQHTQGQISQLQQHTQKLQVTNQNLESTNEELLKTITEQSIELEELRNHLRRAKLDLRTATAKVDEMTKFMKDVQEQMQRTEEDAAEAHGREEASDRRLLQLQTALCQIEGRLKVAGQDVETMRKKEVLWEKQVGELQSRCAALEDEKFEAFQRLRDSLQLAEEAALQRDQAQLREKQRVEELERMKEGMKQLVEEAAVRTRKEVECVRQQCNTQIHRLTEELAALQLECSDKQSQLERAHRERKVVEEELEKVYREGRYGEADLRKVEALHQRCLNAERIKDELEHTLNTTRSNMKKMEMELSEELLRCQEEVRRLQVALSSTRTECSSVSEERLSLQQENQQLHKDMDTLRKECVSAQRHNKLQVSRMQQEVCVKEQAVESKLREMEESHKHSTAELQRRLLAQQQNNKRYREESIQVTHKLQHTITSLRVELSRQKQCCQELEMRLHSEQEKIQECEHELTEQQEKNTRLQTRLTQAEHRASTTSQQLTLMTQRRKTASMMDLETLE